MIRENENITKSLRSINPIIRPLSKTIKQLNLSFKFANLESLINNLNKKVIYRDEYTPTPEKKSFKNDYNIRFQIVNKYINELSDINNLPIVLKNKNYLKNGEFNSDFDPKKIKIEKNFKFLLKKEKERKNKIAKKRNELLEKIKETDPNIMLGKYNPNYDIIKPRIRKIIFSKTNINNKNSWLNSNIPYINSSQRFEEKKYVKNKLKKNNRKISTNNSDINYQTIQENNNNFPSIIFIYNKNVKKVKLKKIKNLRNKSELDKLNIKGYVNFGKMKKRKSLFKKCENSIDYDPNYEYNFPHTPSYIFKYIKNKENHKKYINGKIIRGYSYDPDNYYVMKLKNKSI